MSQPKSTVKRVVLAYSGGLDTSIILKWLQTTYGCEVVTFTADLGQGDELEPARKKAELLGVKPEHIFIEDLREEFVRDYVFPMFRANAQYEGQYLLGTSIARPLIAKRLVEIARQVGADAIAHGATGKGNDQVRFELCAYALEPEIKIIAPWREWEFASRTALIAFAEQHQIPIAKDKRGEAPFSTDANLLHVSSEGKVLEDPALETPGYVYSRTVDPESAPDKPTIVEIAFEKGDPVAIDGERLSPATLLAALNKLGHDNGIGRLDLVENRYVGMKSRGMYETPGGTILLAAHRAIELITLDRGAAHLKDELMPKYAELIYNGFWFAPERELLQTLIDKSQDFVAGRVRLKLYKGGVYVDRPRQPEFALRPGPRHLRGRRRRLRPARRRGLHQAQRAAPAHARQAQAQSRSQGAIAACASARIEGRDAPLAGEGVPRPSILLPQTTSSEASAMALARLRVERDADERQEGRGHRLLAGQFAALRVPHDRRVEDDARRADEEHDDRPGRGRVRRTRDDNRRSCRISGVDRTIRRGLEAASEGLGWVDRYWDDRRRPEGQAGGRQDRNEFSNAHVRPQLSLRPRPTPILGRRPAVTFSTRRRGRRNAREPAGQRWHLFACASSAMPTSGRKAEVIASWLVSSRHCVFHTIAAFSITLAVPTKSTMTGQGEGARVGHGMINPSA